MWASSRNCLVSQVRASERTTVLPPPMKTMRTGPAVGPGFGETGIDLRGPWRMKAPEHLSE